MLDAIDLQILDLLQDNARIPQAEIARVVGLAPSAVLERLRKLESRGVIRGYAAQLDPEGARPAAAGLRRACAPPTGPARRASRQALAAVPEVLEIHHVAGDDCLLLKVRARDPEHLSQILRDRLGRVDGVRSTRTTIVLESIKETTRLPIDVGHRARRGAVMSDAAALGLRRLDCGVHHLGHDVPRASASRSRRCRRC